MPRSENWCAPKSNAHKEISVKAEERAVGRVSYAVAGPIAPRAYYAMSGTDQADGASPYALAMRSPQCAVLTQTMVLRACYAMPSTDVSYAAARWVVGHSGTALDPSGVAGYYPLSAYAPAMRCP
eukprot:3321243-Rhodomonas_salina.3